MNHYYKVIVKATAAEAARETEALRTAAAKADALLDPPGPDSDPDPPSKSADLAKEAALQETDSQTPDVEQSIGAVSASGQHK